MSTKEQNQDDVVVVEATAAVPVVDTAEAIAYEVPGGRWKAGLCGCFGACCCPCLMYFCPVILLGQLMERLKFNLFGCPLAKGKKPMPLCMIFTVLILIMIVLEILAWTVFRVQGDTQTVTAADGSWSFSYIDYSNQSVGFQVCAILLPIFQLFFCIVGICTRFNMRKKYNIEPLCCGDNCCDDCCTSYFCFPCSAIQMVRQTHDEKEYHYAVLSRNGLGANAPEIV